MFYKSYENSSINLLNYIKKNLILFSNSYIDYKILTNNTFYIGV